MSTREPLLSVEALDVRFDAVRALTDVHLDLAEGEFVCVVGPTNAGKSTLLRTLAGLHRPVAGRIRLAGRDIGALEPRDRRVSLLFQNNALFPGRTGFGNIAFALEAQGVKASDVRARVDEVAGQLGVTHLLDRLPGTFSGGEKQRVAIGRAIAARSDLLLLDEPLASLDARLRTALRLQFKQLGRDRTRGIIYVTHDHVEAMSLADRIVVLHEGRIQQIGTPDDIHRRPANRFVATFFGTPPMNVLDTTLVAEGGAAVLAGADFRLPAPALSPVLATGTAGRPLQIGFRPEAVRVSPVATDDTPLPVHVRWVERLGSKRVLDIDLGKQRLRAVVPRDHAVGATGVAWIGFTPQPGDLIDPATGLFLRSTSPDRGETS